jgi:hypothetical protein
VSDFGNVSLKGGEGERETRLEERVCAILDEAVRHVSWASRRSLGSIKGGGGTAGKRRNEAGRRNNEAGDTLQT